MAAATNQSHPPSSTSDKINRETVEKTVKSLLKWRRKSKPSNQEDEFFYLVLSLNKIPHRSLANTHKIPLPHSLLSKSPTFCLIIDDRHKKSLTKNDAEKKIKSENIPVSNVLKLSKLKSDYRTPEKKRELRDSYDVFLADKSVVSMLSGVLGKKKVPVPLDLKERDWKAQIERASCCTLLCLSSGNCYVVRVGKVVMDVDEIVENVIAACNGIAHVVPSKWGNVRSFHLKLLESLSLPIYQTDPDKDSS